MIKNLISIVIPIYNKEECIRRCIDSIIGQTYTDIEVVLIDDGSIDRSGDICKQYCEKDERVRYYYQSNSGPSAARNLGIKKAKGEWIIFVDADDYVDIRMCEIVLNYSEEVNADVILWGSEDESKDVKTEIRISNEETLLWEGKEKVRQLNELMAKGHIGNLRANYILDGPCCKMIHSSLIGSCFFPEGIDYGEDSCFCAMLYDTSVRVRWINRILYHRVTTEGSLSNRRNDDLAYRKAKFIKWLIGYWYNKMDLSNIEVFVTQNTANIYSYYVEKSKLSFKEQRALLDDALKDIELSRYISNESMHEVSFLSRKIIECYHENKYSLFLWLRYVIKPLKLTYHFLKYRALR